MQNSKCPHDNKNSCPQCSQVKMVAYLQNDERLVWYSFFREERKLKDPLKIAGSMGTRLNNFKGDAVKKMMFFNNTTGAKELIAEN